MTDEPSAASPILYSATYTTPSGYARALSRSYFAFGQTRPQNVVLLVAVVLIAVLVGSHFGGILGAVVVLVVEIIALGIGLLRAYRRLSKRSLVIAPEGSTFAIQLKDASVALTGPNASGETDYRAYQSIETRGDFVFLRQRASRIYSVLPAQLFTPEAMSLFITKIGAL